MPGFPASARVIEVTYQAAHHVGFTLQAALKAAIAEGRLSPLPPDYDEEINQRVVALHTKRAYLPFLGARVRQSWLRVRDEVLALSDGATTFDLGPGRRWELGADIESLMAALHSTLDVTVGLAKVVERRVLRLPTASQTPLPQLRALPGISAAEQELFRDARDGFIHNYSAWLAIVINAGEADLAIMTGSTANWDTGEGYVLLSRLDAVSVGFVEHIDAVEASLAERVGQLGRRAS
jgi:hypothetical protein